MRKSLSTCLIVVICITTIILLINYTSNPVFDAVTSTYNTYISNHPTMHDSPSNPSPDNSSSEEPALAHAAEAQLTSVSSLTNSPRPSSPQTFPHLRALCARTTFRPNLYLHCHSFGGPFSNAVHGGLSNAYNRYSTCIRLAVDSGSSLILGPLMQRENDALWNTNWKQVGPETMLDVRGLRERIGGVCPGLEVRGCPGGSCADPESGEFGTIIRAPDHDHREPTWKTGQFREMVDTALREGSNGTLSRSEISIEEGEGRGVKVEFGDSFLAWNYSATSEREVKAEIFRLLDFAPDLLELGRKVQDVLGNVTEGREVVGIHFRGEDDWPSHVLNASAQIDYYYAELVKWNKYRIGKWKLRDIYLSCGDQRMVEMFREMMKLLGWRVHDKHSLLDNEEGRETLRVIEELNFDQKGVVEYVNLKSSARFLGLLPSTLSYLVAYERTLNQTFDSPSTTDEVADEQQKNAGKGRKWNASARGDKIGWFEKYILAGSWRGEGLSKHWPEKIQMRGDEKAELLVVDGQSELSDAFP